MTASNLSSAAVGATAAILITFPIGVLGSRGCPAHEDDLSVTGLSIINDEGMTVLRLEADGSGHGRLSLRDSAGTELVVVEEMNSGGGLEINNHDGNRVALLQTDENGYADFGLEDPEGKGGAALGLTHNKEGTGLIITNQKGAPVVLLVSDGEPGAGKLGLGDGEGMRWFKHE